MSKENKIKVGDFVRGLPDNEKYCITNHRMTRGLVEDVRDGEIKVRVLRHEYANPDSYWVEPHYFEVIGHVKPFDRDAVLAHIGTNGVAELLKYDLTRANLTRANLDGASLRGANLKGANLQDASLDGADLQCANLYGANLTRASLQGANLQDANLDGASLRGADLKGASLDFSCWTFPCKTQDVKIDKRIAAQLLYHVVRATQSVDDAECQAFCSNPAVLALANQFHRAKECGIIMAATKEKTEENTAQEAAEEAKA